MFTSYILTLSFHHVTSEATFPAWWEQQQRTAEAAGSHDLVSDPTEAGH